jgi:uncharacterized protein YggE
MRATVTLMLLSLIALSTPGSALAQSSSPEQTITVIGYGQASAAAETALIQLVVGREDYGAPRAPNPNVKPGAEELEAVSPVVASLEAAQVPADAIQVIVSPTISNFYGPGGRGVARIEIDLDSPTQERIVELIDTAIVGAAENGLVLSLIGVSYSLSDCTTLEREARETALSDARSRGELQAELMGLVLGDPVGATDIPVNHSDAFNAYLGLYTPTQFACAPPVPPLNSGSPLSTPPFDPTAAAEVSVYAQVSIVFDASLGGDATPEA